MGKGPFRSFANLCLEEIHLQHLPEHLHEDQLPLSEQEYGGCCHRRAPSSVGRGKEERRGGPSPAETESLCACSRNQLCLHQHMSPRARHVPGTVRTLETQVNRISPCLPSQSSRPWDTLPPGSGAGGMV